MSTKKLSDKNRTALLIALNRGIEETAERTTSSLLEKTFKDNLTYPPNCGFTKEEIEALNKIKDIKSIESALRKFIADACSYPLFALFNYIDGTGAPSDDWTGVSLVDEDASDDKGDFLHDDFFEKYWEWRKIRPNKGWKLDSYDN